MASAILKFIKKVCVQSMWYWAQSEIIPDGMGGAAYGLPVLVKCRWDGKVQLVLDNKGKEVVSQAEIMVLQEMYPGDRVLLSTPGEDTMTHLITADPIKAHAIIAVSAIPLFMSNDEFERKIFI